MLRVRLGALVAERCVGIREVEVEALDARAEDRDECAALRVLRDRPKRVRFDLQVPRVFDLPALKDRTRRSLGVRPALEGDRLEERLVLIAKVLVQIERGDIADLEVTDLVRPGADRIDIRGTARGIRTEAALVLILLEDRAFRSDAPLEDVRVRRAVGDDHRVRIAGHDALNPVAAIERRGGRRRIALVFIREGHVIGREGRTVRPLQALPELPRHAREIFRDPAVRDRRDLGGKPVRERLAIFSERGERLQHQTGGVAVLRAGGPMRVERARRLPVQDLEVATDAPL